MQLAVTDDDHVRGPEDAPVTLIEYADFECPFCGRAYPVVEDVEKKFAGSLRFVFRHFPLPQHPHAYTAAEASEFGADYDLFWEMHDTLFEHQNALDTPHLLEYVDRLGLDAETLTVALLDRTYRPLVDESIESGVEAGVRGTPTFFINGELFEGEPSREALSAAISSLLVQRARP